MPIYLDPDTRTRRSAQEIPASLGETLKAAAVQGIYDAPVSALMRLDQNQAAEGRGARVDAGAARRHVANAGVQLEVPDEGMTYEALALYIERAKEREARQRVIERGPQGFGPSALQFGAGLVAGQVDPINFGSNFIPVVGWGAKFGVPGFARVAALQTAGRLGEIQAGKAIALRLAGRGLEGSIEGAVGTAMFEPITYYANRQELQDYNAWNSLQNVRDGLLFGAALGGGFGLVGDAWRLKQRGSFMDVDATDFGAPDALGGSPVSASPMAERGALFGGETKILMGETSSDYRPARWAVVDADDVGATMAKADNQWRDRTRAASGEQVRRIAADPDFFRLAEGPDMSVGAPTLSRDGVVIGGNGRMAGIADAYDQGSGMRYKGPLLESLPRYGIDPESIKGMQKPVLVRVLKDEVDVRKAAILSNEQGAMRMSAHEQAKVDAERLGDLSLLEVSDEGDLNTAANRDMVRAWVEQFPATQRAALMDADGRLSAEGHQRLKNAMLARALGDSPTLARLVDSADPGLRNLSTGLTRSAPKIAEAKAAIARGDLYDVDVSGDLVLAVEKLNELREKGETVGDYLAQEELLPWGTPEARSLLGFLGDNLRSSRRIADGIGRFYDALQARGNPNQGDMFGGGAPDKAELLDAALRGATEDMSTAAAVVERVTPETKQAAHTASVLQMSEGRAPRVESIVNSDPNVGTAKPADVQVDALSLEDPTGLFTSNAEASAQVAARAASAPKEWGAEVLDAQIGDVMGIIDQMKKSAEDAFKYARAYHGTPHIFPGDARGELGGFRWDKMGTGEGAQAFGFGHYLAQDERISRSQYRDRLVERRQAEVARSAQLRILDEDGIAPNVKDALGKNYADLKSAQTDVPAEFIDSSMPAIVDIAKKYTDGTIDSNQGYRAVLALFGDAGLVKTGPDAMRVDNTWLAISKSTKVITTKDDPAWKIGDRVVHSSMSGSVSALADAAAQVAHSGYFKAREIFENLAKPYRDALAKAEAALVLGKERGDTFEIKFQEGVISRNKAEIAKMEATLAAVDEVTMQDDYTPAWAEASAIGDSPAKDLSEDFRKRLDLISEGFTESLDKITSYRPEYPVKNIKETIKNLLLDYDPSNKIMTDQAFKWGSDYVLELHPPAMHRVILSRLENGRPGAIDELNFVEGVLQGAGLYIGKEQRILRPDVKQVDLVADKVGPGSVYTAEIPDALEADFLRWDEVFDKQPSKVRDAFEAIMPGFLDAHDDAPRHYDGEDAYRELSESFQDVDNVTEMFGQQVVQDAFDELKRRRGGEYHDDVMEGLMKGTLDKGKADEMVSIMLAQQGVHGQKFLDGNSRGLSQDNPKARFNYVIFDDETASLVSRYMRGEGGMPADPVSVRAALELSFGKSTEALLKTGNIEIVATVADLPKRTDGIEHELDTSAMTAADGRVWIVAENASPAMARGLVLHEVGVHVGLEPMLGRQGFADVLDQLDLLLKSGDPIALAARAAVPENTPASLVREEHLAYLVQHHPELGLVRRIIAAVRAWAYENLEFARSRIELTTADLQALATAAVRKVAREVDTRSAASTKSGVVKYSRGAEEPIPTPEEDLAQAEEGVKRVKEYEKALRAGLAAGTSENARLGAMLEATGYKLNMDEAQALLAQVAAVRSQMRGNPNQGDLLGWDAIGVSQEEAAAAARLVEQLNEAALIEKRNAALSVAAKHRNLSLAKKFSNLPGGGGNVAERVGRFVFHWQGHIEGLMASLDGSQFLREGSRRSVNLEARVLTGQWLGSLIHDLEKQGLWEHFVSDVHGPDVWQALSRISTAEVDKAVPDFAGLHPDAVKIAQVVSPLVKDQQIQKNAVGAWIKDLRGYVSRQTHDMQKIRDAGFAAWRDKVVSWGLDVDKMTKDSGDRRPMAEVLRGVYDELADGKFHQAEPLENQAAFSGPGNLAKKVSQHRVLHFASPLGGYHYMREFGRGGGNLAETLMEGMRQSAREVALMKVWGPNYEANIAHVMKTIEGDLTGRDLDLFRAQKQRVLDLLHYVDGALDVPGRDMVAKVGTALRAWQSMAKLGGALITSVNDIPVFASAVSQGQDRSFLGGMSDAIGSLLQGRPKGERKEVLHALGVFFDSQVAGVHSKFTGFDDAPGLSSMLMQQFFKLNGLTWWTETLRSSAALSFSSHLAGATSKGWDGLGRGMQQTLTRYRIDAGLWDLLRQSPLQAADGRMYLTPEGVRTVPDTALEGYLRGRGQEVSAGALARLRAELSTALRSLVVDQSEYAVLEPGARVKNRVLQGTQKGTGAGELFRFMAQFKSFSFTYLDAVLGREVYGRGYDTMGEYLKRGKGDMLALARLGVAMTLFGYASMTAKGLLRGQEPRDAADPRTWMASFIQGGSAGIFGDFLFGNFSRQSRTLSATAAGPVLGALDEVVEMYTRVREGDDVAGTAFNKALSQTPFLNLFYLRPALNYLFLWSAQEAMNPGSLRRMEKKQQKDQGVEYWNPPSEGRLRPFE